MALRVKRGCDLDDVGPAKDKTTIISAVVVGVRMNICFNFVSVLL